MITLKNNDSNMQLLRRVISVIVFIEYPYLKLVIIEEQRASCSMVLKIGIIYHTLIITA
jgi:hypothetical protein